MKINRVIKAGAVAIAIVALSLAAGGRFLPGQHGGQAALAAEKIARVSPAAGMIAPGTMPLGLPAENAAKAILNASLLRYHPQWLEVPFGSVKIRAFVIYPELAGKAPVVVITAHNQGLSDWVRAVGTEVVTEGYVAVVPDLLSGTGPNGGGTDSFASREAIASALTQLGAAEIERREKAVRDYFVNQLGTNGNSAMVDFNLGAGELDTAINTPTQKRVVTFDLGEHAWHNTLALLTNLADPAAMPQGGRHTATERQCGLRRVRSPRARGAAGDRQAKRPADGRAE